MVVEDGDMNEGINYARSIVLSSQLGEGRVCTNGPTNRGLTFYAASPWRRSAKLYRSSTSWVSSHPVLLQLLTLQGERMATHRCRVLLVDDHEGIRDTLRKLLTAYEDVQVVGEARDGAEAIQRVASCQPDIILLDVNMPNMNGIEAATFIRKLWTDTIIIGLCVVHDTYITEAFLKAGALAVVSKARLEDLHSTIQRACVNRLSAPEIG
jgi:CheY-like chemotaxis protein